MKNKFMFVAFVFILFSSTVFAAIDVDKKYNLRERTKVLEEQVRLLQSQVDVDLSNAELDIIGETGPWVTSAIIATYDNERLTGSTNTRVSNSRLRIDRGFITIGQLNKCPLYLTIGQIFAPFGRYSSNMITTTPTRSLGLFKDRI